MEPKSFRILLAGILIAWVASCTPSVERYKNKARKALQKEDSTRAKEYLQKAFEASLDRQSFPLGRWETYSNVYSSLDRNRMVLTENQPSRLKAYFTVYDPENDSDWKRRVKGYLSAVSLSPNGQYGVLHVTSEAGKCFLEVWDLSAKDTVHSPFEVACGQTAGVSSEGEIVFIDLKKQISLLKTSNGFVDEKIVDNFPETPDKNIPALSLFQYTSDGQLLMVTGSFGLYYLYVREGKNFRLISRDGASLRLFFIPGSHNPGLIIGGASLHQVAFYSTESYSAVQTFPVRYWKDAVFLRSSDYYYIEDERLVEVSNGVENRLPVWGTLVYAGKGGNIFVLTPLGHLIRYNQNQIGEESQAIFQMGWEIK